MIIITNQLLLRSDDIILVKADVKTETTRVSQFCWFKPQTWFLPAKSKDVDTFFVEINYLKNGREDKFTITRNTAAGALETFKEVAEQVKLQLKVQNQEMVDVLFENAIKESK